MSRRILLACCLMSVAAVAAAEAPANLTAEQVIEKNLAARGGLAAWRAVQTLTFEGTLDAGGTKEHPLPFVLKLKRPHKSRLEIVFKDQTSVQVYDGTQGWKVRPFLNRGDVEPYTAAEQASAAAADELDGPLVDYAAKGTKVSLVGTEKIEGHPAYRLRLTSGAGLQRNLWIDASTFLETRIDGEPRILDGKPHKVWIYYRDFQTDHGLATPRLLETAVDGVKATHKMQIAKVSVNDKLDDALFQKPKPVPVVAPGLNLAPAPAPAPTASAASAAAAAKPAPTKP